MYTEHRKLARAALRAQCVSPNYETHGMVGEAESLATAMVLDRKPIRLVGGQIKPPHHEAHGVVHWDVKAVRLL